MEVVPDVATVFAHSVAEWQARVDAVDDSHWDRSTPCSDWSVRDLVNHVVGEQRWVVPLLEGRTIAEVGDSLDGDLLGQAPHESAASAAKAAVAAFSEPGATERIVHLSFGDTPAAEYAWQLVADHVVHGWDLAAALDIDRHLDHDLVVHCAQWWQSWEEVYRGAGAIASRVELPPGASRQDRLIASFGREPAWSPVRAVLDKFGAAWEAWDMPAAVAMLAPDAVFESTGPAPDGRRLEGVDAIRAEWAAMAAATRDPEFRFEEVVVAGDRAVARWRFGWTNDDGSDGHVRGVDVIRVADGQIAEKLSYVKG
jgi:uncharacterized protein (TIGR03086 family)